jgi:molecular chaperone HscB
MRTFFDVLGVPRAFHLPDGDLERRFHALSREHHPDRFAQAAPRERLEALRKTTELNDAYRVLKHDVKRAEYLLKLEGYDVADERSRSVKPDPALLMEMMERNEAIADARAAGDQAKLAALRDQVVRDRGQALALIDAASRSYDAGDRGALPRIADAVLGLRYYLRLLEAIDGREEL